MTQVTQEHLDSKLEDLESRIDTKLDAINDKVSMHNKVIAVIGGFMSLVMTIIVTLFIAQTISLSATIKQVGENKFQSIQNKQDLTKLDK